MKRVQKKKTILAGLCVILAALAVSACVKAPADTPAQAALPQQTAVDTAAVYHTISPVEAKTLIDAQADIILLDVREQYEFDEGHIPGAVLLPSGGLSAMAPEVLTDQNAKILVYCRSGNRSRTAANLLISMGYTQVYDLGGIIDWPYDVVTDVEKTEG